MLVNIPVAQILPVRATHCDVSADFIPRPADLSIVWRRYGRSLIIRFPSLRAHDRDVRVELNLQSANHLTVDVKRASTNMSEPVPVSLTMA